MHPMSSIVFTRTTTAGINQLHDDLQVVIRNADSVEYRTVVEDGGETVTLYLIVNTHAPAMLLQRMEYHKISIDEV